MKATALQTYCETHSLDYQTLADRLGISRSYACQLKRGSKPMTLGIARRVSKAFGLSLETLLNHDGKGKR